MQTPVTSESLTSLTDRLGVGSAPSPEVDTPQPHVEHTMVKRSKTDFTSGHAVHEGNQPIPFKSPIRPYHIVDNYDAYGRCLVQEVDLTDAILVCRLNMRAAHPESSTLDEEEELLELLDFGIDIEKILGSSDSLQQERPKGRMLKFEVPARMKAMPPANFVHSSNSTGAVKVIEFRRPGHEPTVSEKQIS